MNYDTLDFAIMESNGALVDSNNVMFISWHSEQIAETRLLHRQP